MNKIRSQFKITKPASIAAALLALVLSFAGTTLARNTQTSDSGTPPTTSEQVDPQSATQQYEMQTGQQPGAMSSQQRTDTGYAKSHTKLSKEEKAEQKAKEKAKEKAEADEYVCTPDTPTTSAACDLP